MSRGFSHLDFVPPQRMGQQGTLMNGAPVQSENQAWIESIAQRMKASEGNGEAAFGFTDDPDAYQNLLQMFEQAPLTNYGTRLNAGAPVSPAMRDAAPVSRQKQLVNGLKRRKKDKPEKDHR